MDEQRDLGQPEPLTADRTRQWLKVVALAVAYGVLWGGSQALIAWFVPSFSAGSVGVAVGFYSAAGYILGRWHGRVSD